jgi:uncharacterized protein YkwD
MLLASCSAGSLEGEEGSDGGGGGGGNIDAGGGGGPVEGEPTALMGITAAHNAVRSAHGVADIAWDNDLAAIAQNWADGCQWGHNAGRSDNYPDYVGENIYGSSNVPSGAAVTQAWASEEADYNYDNNTCSAVCGHYTQIVWAKSTKLGCAIASCPNGQVQNFVVCNYAPGGNFNGEKPY